MATTVRIEGDPNNSNDVALEETLRELVDPHSDSKDLQRFTFKAAGRQAKQTVHNMKKAADNIKNASLNLKM